MNKEQLNPDVLKRRAIRGTLLLVIRKFFLRGIGYMTFLFVISKILSPAELGIFAIVNFVVTFLGFFSDSGFGAALIRREKVDEESYRTTFTLQLLFVLILVILVFFASEWFASVYALGEDGLWILRALSLSLFFASLKTIPMIQLERGLRFDRIIIPEILEVLTFQGLLVALLLNGVGIKSFVYAILVRGVVGVGALTVVSPWKIQLGLAKSRVQELLRFGIPFQSNYFIALLKDSLTPWFVGFVAGPNAVGFLNWAFTVSKFPIEFVSEVFRVTFPTFARIQDNKPLLRAAVERSLQYTNMVLFPAVFILAALIAQAEHVLFAGKWADAIPAVYIHSFGILFFGIVSTCTNALWALGRVRDGVIFMFFSTMVNWAVSVPLVFAIGYNGAMIGSTAVLVLSCPLAIFLLRRHVEFSFWRQTIMPFLAGSASGFILWLLAPHAVSFLRLLLFSIFGGLLYILFLFLLERQRLIVEIQWFIRAIRPQHADFPQSQGGGVTV